MSQVALCGVSKRGMSLVEVTPIHGHIGTECCLIGSFMWLDVPVYAFMPMYHMMEKSTRSLLGVDELGVFTQTGWWW